MKKVKTNTVILDWGERTFFGKVKGFSPIGYSRADGDSRDLQLEHQVIVDRVLLHYSGQYEQSIRSHVRNVLELQVEGLHDLRRFGSPLGVWDQFVQDVATQFDETRRSACIE